MGVLPRRLIKQNLNEVEVFIQDDNNEFIVVQDLPDTFGQGRSSFKVFGSDFLKPGIKLRAEILDVNGTPIFITPVRYRYNNQIPTLPYTYFTIEVYPPPINVGGKAELVILGELDNEKINVPQEFVGRYNVKFRKTINIDVSKTKNEAPILFYKKPSVTTNEIVKKRLIPRGTNLTITRIISGSGLSGFPLNAGDRYFPDPSKIVRGTVGETPPNTDTTDTQESTSTIKEAPGGDFTELVNLKSFKTGEVRTPNVLAKANKFELFFSEEPPTMKIFSTGSLFTSDMVGGEIRIPSGSIVVYNPKQFIGEGNVGIGTGFQTFPANLDLAGGSELEGAKIFIPNYTASIERVVNDKEIHVKEPFWFQYGDGANTQYYLANFGNHPYVPITSPGSPRANFTMSFVETTTAETSSFAFDSFLDFNIKNLRTFSGDVYRLRVSGGSKTQVSDFPTLLDTILESPQLLIDSDSPSGVLRTGYIQSQAHITKYWESSANLSTTFDSTELIDSVKLSGSLSQKDDVGRFSLKSAYNFETNKDVVYTLSMRIVGKKGLKLQEGGTSKNTAVIKFHISGSNVSPDINPKYSEPNTFGKTLKDDFGNVVGLQLDEESSDKVDYGKVSHTFKVPFKKSRVTNLDSILQFRVESGEWFVSDISLRPALDTGFSPDNVKVRVPIPTNTQRPDKFQFILQYYDVDNNEAEEVTLVDDVDVEGQSLLIQGDDNLVKGTITVGNVQGEGVEIKGGNSAFIRAVGYTGFKDASAGTGGGFFLWSGSVAPGGETQDTYNGAGLEIHDGNTGANESFFKFRTDDADNANNSTFDLKTSRFFLGGGGQFISGSLGNIEISSSNFHLQNDGDVVMQGTITAEAGGTIGGFTINANDLTGGSGASTIKLASGVGIHLGNANLASAPFSVTNAGVLKAESGTIGGFTLGSETITGGNLVLDEDGTIRSSDFVENEAGSGFRLTAANGGMLEVESARIRGTLKTTTFEKETVNAVGGQLYIANSTVLTGSVINPNGIHTSTQTTMSVENASGFVDGEIAIIKKVSPTGFSTEYLLINSASRNDPSSDVDASGNLFVTRGFGNGVSGISGSLGDTPGAAQSYSGSQVIVSTGRLNTGFMRLNANPNDISTPFMDIVERTGSGIYDVELKTRLGDLSGVAGTRNIPSGFEGFGLMTETAFLSGSNIKLEAPRFLLGDLNSTFVSGSNRNIEISSSRFHLQPDGDTIMQGKITATSGTIGGFNIDSDLDSTSGTLKLKGASGQITGSNVLFDGGKIGGFDVSANEISSSGMSLDSANQVVIFRDVDGSTLGTAGQEALRISFDGSAVIPSGTTTTTGERARIHVPSGSLAASDLVINTEVLNNVRIVPGRLRCFRKDGSGLPSDGNGKSILNPTNLGNNFNKHLDAAAYFPNSNIDGDFSTLDFNLGVLGYASRGTNSSTSRQVALYGLSNVGAGAISIYGEVLQENGGYSGVFHGGQLVVGDVIGTGGSGVDSTTDSDFVFVAYPNDIDGGTYNSYKGRVGINKRLPDTALHVNGTISGSLFGPILSSTISGSLINSSGDVVAFQSSDKKLKDNVSVILKPIEKVKQISGYEFDWNNKQDIYQGHDFGVIAQEVEKVMPELVRTNSNGFKGVKYEKIVPLLIESIKEQQKQIDELKKKLEEL